MVAWWSGDTDASDIFGQVHGSLQGGASIGQGLVLGAFDLTAGGYVSVPDSVILNLTNAITVEAWVYQSSQTSYGPIVAKTGFSLDVSGSYTFFNVSLANGNGIGTGASGSATTNQWFHLAGTYDGSTLRTYENGALKSSASVTGLLRSSPNPLYIGRDFAIPSAQFYGLIDEVSIYNRALSAGEIGNLLGRCCWQVQTTSGTADPHRAFESDGPGWDGGVVQRRRHRMGTAAELPVAVERRQPSWDHQLDVQPD